MKTESKKNIELAEKLFHAINLRKKFEAEETRLKKEVKDLMGESLVLEAGNVIIMIDERIRTDIDKKSLISEMGKDVVSKFEVLRAYEVMNVRMKG